MRGSNLLSPPGAIQPGLWAHIAVVRDGDVLLLFVDGTLSGASDVTGLVYPNFSGPLHIGAGTVAGVPGDFLVGYLDEVRITNGIAQWTAGFTPPAAPYSGGLPPPPVP